MAGLGILTKCAIKLRCNCRSFVVSSVVLGKGSLAKQKNIVRKSNAFLERKLTEKDRRNKKTQWYDTPIGFAGLGGLGTTKKGPSAGSKRRAHQLSVVLSQYVISLINSGELDGRLPELGVEINKVKLIPDLGALHVYWLATGTENDEHIQSVLQEVSYKLRSMLTGLQVMNYLPPIVFIKDVSQVRLQKVNQLLDRADMGPDHEETEMGADLKSDIVLPQVNNTLSHQQLQEAISSVNRKLSTIDVNTSTIVQDVPKGLSEEKSDFNIKMRSDIYDLDHLGLTQKVIQLKRKKANRGLEISQDGYEEQGGKVMPHLSKQEIEKFLARSKYKTEKRASSKSNLASELYVDHHAQNDLEYSEEEDSDIDYEDFDVEK